MNEQTNNTPPTQPGTSLSVMENGKMPVRTVIGDNAGELHSFLLDNIKKLQTNPDFLSQAKEIRENVKQIVDIGRLQVEMIKLSKDTAK